MRGGTRTMLPTGAMTLMISTKKQTTRANAKKAMKSLSRGDLLRGTTVRGRAGGCIMKRRGVGAEVVL